MSWQDPDRAVYGDPATEQNTTKNPTTGRTYARSRKSSQNDDKFTDYEPTFLFYDLETSGLNPREDRIMQFAGQRTDPNLEPIGEPFNILVKMDNDTLPSPGAINVTKITPQKTLEEGIPEREFAKKLVEEIFTPGTTIVGYNNVRFDDEFIRHLLWRNFYEPYTWHWQDGRSRWDILDLVRLTRALRPEGINWPLTQEGKPTNRLELITKLNHIEHEHAHDALADVYATIAVAKLIKKKQPQLFDFLYSIRRRADVKKYVNLERKTPFVYTSGRYSAKYNKTTVAFPLTAGENGSVYVFDLRYNLDELEDAIKNNRLAPEEYENLVEKSAKSSKTDNPDAEKPSETPEDSQKTSQNSVEVPRFFDSRTFFPIVKKLALNKCPAVAPLGVLEKDDGWKKVGLAKETVEKNLKSLLKHPDFAEKIRTISENERESRLAPPIDSESALYDGFLDDHDSALLPKIRAASGDDLEKFFPEFLDERLDSLLLHYKAKNFPDSLTESEQISWEDYRHARLNRAAPKFLEELAKLADTDGFLAEELMLYYQSLQDSDY